MLRFISVGANTLNTSSFLIILFYIMRKHVDSLCVKLNNKPVLSHRKSAEQLVVLANAVCCVTAASASGWCSSASIPLSLAAMETGGSYHFNTKEGIPISNYFTTIPCEVNNVQIIRVCSRTKLLSNLHTAGANPNWPACRQGKRVTCPRPP